MSEFMETFDFSALSKLSSLTEIIQLLHETYLRERVLEADLEELQLKRADVEGNLATLHAATIEVHLIGGNAEPMY